MSPTPELETRTFSWLNWGCGAPGSPQDGFPASADALQRDFFTMGAGLHLQRGVHLL